MKIIKILLLLIIISIVAMVFFMDTIIKSSIQKYGSQMLTTPVFVAEVRSDVLEQSIMLQGISVANPTGFSGDALSVGSLVVDLAHIGDVIAINTITIDSVVVNVMQNAQGINLLQLQDAITTYAQSDRDDTDDNHQDKHSDHNNDMPNDMRIKIGSFAITNSVINVDTDIVNKQITLPDTNLVNIGGDEGILVSELAPYLISYLTKEVKKLLSGQGIEMLEDKLQQSLMKNLTDKLGIDADNTEDISDVLQESLSESEKNLKQKTKEFKDQLDEQKEKIKDIFKL